MVDKVGQEVAYLRVSTKEQNLARQEAMGERADKVFREKRSGKDRERPVLAEAMAYLREGDILVVWSVDRLARSIQDLKSIMAELHAKGVSIRFEKDAMTFAPGDRATAAQKLQLNVLGMFAEFERDISRERQAEGIAEAKRRGVYDKRKKNFALSKDQVEAIKESVSLGVPKAKLAKQYGVSRQTIYTALKDPSYAVQEAAA